MLIGIILVVAWKRYCRYCCTSCLVTVKLGIKFWFWVFINKGNPGYNWYHLDFYRNAALGNMLQYVDHQRAICDSKLFNLKCLITVNNPLYYCLCVCRVCSIQPGRCETSTGRSTTRSTSARRMRSSLTTRRSTTTRRTCTSATSSTTSCKY